MFLQHLPGQIKSFGTNWQEKGKIIEENTWHYDNRVDLGLGSQSISDTKSCTLRRKRISEENNLNLHITLKCYEALHVLPLYALYGPGVLEIKWLIPMKDSLGEYYKVLLTAG